MKNKLLILGVLGLAFNPAFAAKKAKTTVNTAVTAADALKVDVVSSVVDWKGTKVTGAHNGKIKIKEGSLELSGSELKGGQVVIDMTSIVCDDLKDATYNEKLVGHLKNDDFFSVEKHPTATFKISNVKALKVEDSSFELTGDLTIKGKTHPLTFPAKITNKDGVLTAQATFKVDRTKYDIKYGSGKFFEGLGDKMIHDDFELQLNVTAKK